jgi:hypothetical protein
LYHDRDWVGDDLLFVRTIKTDATLPRSASIGYDRDHEQARHRGAEAAGESRGSRSGGRSAGTSSFPPQSPRAAHPVPRWAFQHFTKRDDALAAAREFTEQADGNEVFVPAVDAL